MKSQYYPYDISFSSDQMSLKLHSEFWPKNCCHSPTFTHHLLMKISKSSFISSRRTSYSRARPVLRGANLGQSCYLPRGYCTILIAFRSLLSVHFQNTICVKCFPTWNQYIIFSIRKRRSYNPSHHINLPLSMEVARSLGHRSKW